MLDGYDNPDPTPRPPLTGLDFNHRFPKGPIQQVAPFSERIMSSILRDESRDLKPTRRSLVVIPETGLWRKIGNKTFYRLYGLDYVHHSIEKNGIQKAIDKAQSRVFVKDATYPITANEVLKGNFHLEGETSTLTKLQATTNGLKLLTVNAGPLANTRVLRMGFDANTKTGTVGVDFNETNSEINQTTQNNYLHDLYFYNNTFTTLVDLTGCEASILDLLWSDNATNTTGEVYLKTFNGDITGSRIIFPQPGGTAQAVHIMGQQVKIYNSVLNQIMVENQVANSTTYTSSGLFSFRDLFLANGQPSGVHKFVNSGNQSNVALSTDWEGCDFGLKGNSTNTAAFASSGTGSFISTYVNFRNCMFVSLDASAQWVRAPVGSIMTMGKKMTWENNYLTGSTIALGDFMTGGWGQFNFQPPPAGWSLTLVPAVPAGTGSGNARRCFYNRPVRIYAAGTISGTHIIDAGPLGDGANPVDTALGIDPNVVQLDYGEQIYYGTTVPTTWKWYGL